MNNNIRNISNLSSAMPHLVFLDLQGTFPLYGNLREFQARKSSHSNHIVPSYLKSSYYQET